MKRKGGLALIFLCAATALTSPYWATDEQATREALQDKGLTPTKIGGSWSEYGWFRGNFNLYVTKFEARDKDGKTVQGYFANNPGSKKGTLEIDTP